MVSDEEDSDKEEMNEERERDALADELFDGDGDESEVPRERVSNEFESLDVDEEDDEDGKLCYCVEWFIFYSDRCINAKTFLLVYNKCNKSSTWLI